MRRTLSSLVGGLAMISLVVIAGPAQARTTVLRDGSHDVMRHQLADPWVPAPRVTNGDVLRTRVVHHGRTIGVRTTYAALRRLGQYAGYDLIVQNGAGKRLEFLVETGPSHWRGVMRAFRASGREAKCGASWAIDYADDTVEVRVPRGCLGDPRRVRVRVLSSWADAQDTFFTDNPHNHTEQVRTWSPWVRHTR